MWPGWAQSRRRCGRPSRTHRKRRVRERSSGSSPRPSAASTSSAALPNAARHAQASRHDKGRGCAPRIERVRGAQARRSGWAGWDSRCDARAVSNRARAYAVANAPGAATYFRPQSASRRPQPTRPATQMRVGSQQQTAMNRIGCCLGTWGVVVWSARAQRRRCRAEAPPPGLQTSRAGPSRGCPSAPSPARVSAHRNPRRSDCQWPHSPDADVAAMSPVAVQDVGAVSPVSPGADMAAVGLVPAQMWAG